MTYHKDPSVYYGMDFTFFGNVDSSHADDPDTMRSTGVGFSSYAQVKDAWPPNQVKHQTLL